MIHVEYWPVEMELISGIQSVKFGRVLRVRVSVLIHGKGRMIEIMERYKLALILKYVDGPGCFGVGYFQSRFDL